LANRNNPVLSERFHEAAAYASKLHHRQVRKGSMIPYVSHVFSTSSLVMEFGGDETQAIAALLHDAIEDQNVTFEDIEEQFGRDVAAIVEACSDTFGDAPHSANNWAERKQRTIDGLDEVPYNALLVIAADKLHNASATYRSMFGIRVLDALNGLDRFRGRRNGITWYYNQMGLKLRTIAWAGAQPGDWDTVAGSTSALGLAKIAEHLYATAVSFGAYIQDLENQAYGFPMPIPNSYDEVVYLNEVQGLIDIIRERLIDITGVRTKYAP
jgi:hypothetical protein